MSHDSATFATTTEVRAALAAGDEVFRYCHFESARLEGGDSDGVFLSCTFQDFEWYWGIFNMALFVDCKFERCTFRGTSFAGCRLVDCSFNDCRFLPDNLGAACSSSDTGIYGCAAENCVGFKELFPARVH